MPEVDDSQAGRTPKAPDTPATPASEDVDGPLPLPEPPGRSPFDPVRAFIRTAALSLGLGILAAVLTSLAAASMLEGQQAWLARSALSDGGRALAGLGLLTLVQAATAFALTLLAGLIGDWRDSLGAGVGFVNALLPAVIVVAAQGFVMLLPWPLLCARLAGMAACVLAGWAGLRLGKRLVRRPAKT